MLENGHNDGDDGDLYNFEFWKEEKGVEEDVTSTQNIPKIEENGRHRRHGVIDTSVDNDSLVTAPSSTSVIPVTDSVIDVPKFIDSKGKKTAIRFYSEAADYIPVLSGNERMCYAIRFMLLKGDPIRIDNNHGPSLVKLTGAPEKEIRSVIERLPLRCEKRPSGEFGFQIGRRYVL